MNQSRSAAYFRASDWWIGKASALLALVYGYALWFSLPFMVFLPLAGASLITIIGFAMLGYQLNDWYDQSQDALSGKSNMFSGKSAITAAGYFFLALLLIFLPWLFLPFDRLSMVLITMQLLAFFLYAHPLTRWKEKPFLGMITDTLYAHVLPTLLSLYTFSLAAEKSVPPIIYFLLTAAQFVNGLRNILLHRLADAEADKAAGVFNEMITANQQHMFRLASFLVPVEGLCAGGWLYFFLSDHHWLWLVFSLFALLLYGLSFLQQHLQQMPVLRKLNWSHFPNFLWEWGLSFLFLIALIQADKLFLLLAFFHLLLFYGAETGDYLSRVVEKSYHFFLTYLFYPGKKGLSFLVNYTIYYFMRLLGVDLVRENTTFLGYWRRKRKDS